MTQIGMFETPRSWTPLPPKPELPDEIIVDSFAGGGGASEGIRRALGRSPHVAVNHKPEMIALHAANHPDSEHFPKDVWKIDPTEVCRGRPVGLMWLSPDCTHFSKAKGTKPVSKKIRGLAWVAIRWAATVRPRVIILENVEEFEGWGPVLRETSRPCPRRRGQTFKAFVNKLRRFGYQVEWRRLRACDFGAPTTRQRLFLIARCDGQSIVWPEATHGPGRLKPWRTAAECIDWSIPCPSIFLTKGEAKRLGFNVKRPLVDKTLRRIARGVYRFVINNPRPFIVPMQHANRPVSIDEPLQTITTQGNKFNIVAPVLATYHSAKRSGDDRARSVDAPPATLDTSNRYGLVAPYLVPTAHAGDDRTHSIEEPVRTITGGHRGDHALVAPFMVPRYGEEPTRNHGEGQPPRSRSVEEPMPTIVPSGNGAQLVAAFMAKHFGGHETPGTPANLPFDTVTSRDHHALVAASIAKFYGDRIGSAADEPLGTVMATSAKHALVASSLVKLKGTARHGQPIDEPLHTIQAAGNHYAEVRAFLAAYYSSGSGMNGHSAMDPLPSVTPHDRFALVMVAGQPYAIIDIGMRMLQPRELFRAQGFYDSYVIDIEINGRPITKEIQTEMVGNSVSPDNAAALVAANYRPSITKERAA